MSRFTDLLQEPTPASEVTPTPTPEPVKVDNVVEFKPRSEVKSAKKKFTMD
jgi:hypothetical protein